MHKIRRAAVAGATALALTLTAAPAATAAGSESSQGLAEQLRDKMEGRESADVDAFFPTETQEASENQSSIEEQPIWAKILFGTTIVGAIGTILGLIVAPIYNFFTHG